MGVLLARDEVVLLTATGGEDTHGWAVSVPVQGWRGFGNVQESQPNADATATSRGGHGVHGPDHRRRAVAYLPVGFPGVPGSVVSAHGTTWTVADVRPSLDPTGSGDLDCVVATLREVSRADQPDAR